VRAARLFVLLQDAIREGHFLTQDLNPFGEIVVEVVDVGNEQWVAGSRGEIGGSDIVEVEAAHT